MTHRVGWAGLALLCGVCTGCFKEFDETRVRLVTEGNPIRLDSEQVSLTLGEVDCGVDKDLWDPPEVVSERSVARLRQGARDLGFADDISINEPGYNLPYSQLRGEFMLHMQNLIDIKDGPGKDGRTVQAQMAVKIPHQCFNGDLPIMGIRRGQFNPGLPPTMEFQLENDGWHMDHFVH